MVIILLPHKPPVSIFILKIVMLIIGMYKVYNKRVTVNDIKEKIYPILKRHDITRAALLVQRLEERILKKAMLIF